MTEMDKIKQDEAIGREITELLKMKATERSPRFLLKRLELIDAHLFFAVGVPNLGTKIAAAFFELFIVD